MKFEFTTKAEKLWNEISDKTKTKILNNVWCGNCTSMSTIVYYKGRVEKGDIILEGECVRCNSKVARLIEIE